MTSLSRTKIMWSSARHSWRVSLSVIAGVATATAVIVGALLVGDSMRGSLRGLTVERLGNIDTAVIPGGFFDPAGIVGDQSASGENAASPTGIPAGIHPVILFPAGAVEFAVGGDASAGLRRAGAVQIIGIDDAFWDLDVSGIRPKQLPGDDSVVLNRATAEELGVSVGDVVTVRLPVEGAVPADSPLGRRDLQTEGLPGMSVVAIIPDRGLGRFSLAANQAAPRNVFLSRSVVAEVLDRDGQANALLADHALSAGDLEIDLPDLGLKITRHQQTFAPDQIGGAVDVDSSVDATSVFDYYSLTSDRLLVPDAAVEAVVASLPPARTHPITTYLANAIERVDDQGNILATVPYSILTATESLADLPLDFTLPVDNAAADATIPMVINSWTADRLTASVGTRLRVAYYEPEVEDGLEIERYAWAIVTAVVPITEPARPYLGRRAATFAARPTVFNDPDLTPTVPGVTDQDSISDWDLPFQLTRTIDSIDDDYWKYYRLTPKAFIPLADGERLFGSRFGKTTGIRIDRDDVENQTQLESAVLSALQPRLADLGWDPLPLRQQQLSASGGTTPFDALFLSLSFFVIFAAVMLIAMLFRLGLVSRLKQYGTLLATGWTPKQVAKLASGEGMILSSIGIVFGVFGGFVYATFILWALRNWWVGAVTVPFLEFHWTPQSLLIGAMGGWIVSVVTVAVTARSLLKANVRMLLAGRDQDSDQPISGVESMQGSGNEATSDTSPGQLRWVNRAAAGIGIVAVLAAAAGAAVGGQAAAGGFVGGGMLMLSASLLFVYGRLRQPRRIGVSLTGNAYSVDVLASRNAARNPLRSTLSIGLMATAAFLIIAINAFQLQPTEKGTGGFNLIAESAQPLFRPLDDKASQRDMLAADASKMVDSTFASLRLRPGQDASCNNLYRASQPTVVGIPDSFPDRFSDDRIAFEFAAAGQTADGQNPWTLLATEADGSAENPIPVIMDQNTAMWSFQMMGGVGETKSFEYFSGRPVHFRVVALLMNSVLQGKLLIGEQNFTTAFPEITGYRLFLARCPADQQTEVSVVLENRLGDIGMDVSDSATVLAGMLAVQNTYLRTFQSLGALGLLLGTIGLAIAQLRSVLERRKEIAVMQAIGFTHRRLARVVLGETLVLLIVGIGCGVACAVLAVLPHALLSGIRPSLMQPVGIVIGIAVFGMLAGLVAVRQVSRLPLLGSLAGE